MTVDTSTRDLHAELQRLFGFGTFQPEQEEAIRALLEGKNVYLNLATSGGKSLVFQLSALMLEGLTLVISPLIALMKDQVEALVAQGHGAAFINSTLSSPQKQEVWRGVRQGKIKLLYLSPETLTKVAFLQELGTTKVSLVAVDEAHCVSAWGHDFRRDYREIRTVVDSIGYRIPMLAATATASDLVLDDILTSLGITDAVRILGDLRRPNLNLSIELFDADGIRRISLLQRLQDHSRAGEKAIVYCRTRAKVRALLEQSAKDGIAHCAMYHGEMEDDDRERTQEQFASGEVFVLFATNAFGMGVNIPDIRYVYHCDMPSSLEAYWQEIGRAGRDGHSSSCVLLFCANDFARSIDFILGASVKLSAIKAFWENLVRSIKSPDSDGRYPPVYFVEEEFIARYAKGNSLRENQGRGLIAQLVKHRMIRISGRRMYVLVRLEEVAGDAFPITEESLLERRQVDILHLKSALFYALHGMERSNPQDLVIDYLRTSELFETICRFDLQGWYAPSPEVLMAILTALAEADHKHASFDRYLRGVGPGKGTHHGTLNQFGKWEVRFDLDYAIRQNLVRRVEMGKDIFVTLTEQGVAFLVSSGVGVVAPTSYKELATRCYQPVSKRVLRSCLSTWWSSLGMAAGEPLPTLDEFLGAKVEVLNKKLTGLALVAKYLNKRAKRAEPRLGVAVPATWKVSPSDVSRADVQTFFERVFGDDP